MVLLIQRLVIVGDVAGDDKKEAPESSTNVAVTKTNVGQTTRPLLAYRSYAVVKSLANKVLCPNIIRMNSYATDARIGADNDISAACNYATVAGTTSQAVSTKP